MADENSNKEPVYTGTAVGSLATGTSFVMLQEPIQNILLEIGASDRLAKSLVTVLMFATPFLIGWATAKWTRKQTVPVGLANRQIEAAFDMPANSPQHKLEELKIGTGDGNKKEN
jgi:hypothetical protein